MRQQLNAIHAEYIKNKHAKIRWVTFLAFALAPLFGAVFMILMKGNGYDGLSGAFRAKATLMSFEANWTSYLNLLAQAVGIGGIIIFGFVASWLFGREYAEGTAKDILSLPVSRTKIINAKFVYYLIWCVALVISNLIIALVFGTILGLEGWSTTIFIGSLKLYFTTTVLVIAINTLIGFFALWGKGYLTPLGIVVVLMVLAQILGAMGFGQYFPWSVPGIYSRGGELKETLDVWSFALVAITGIIGYFASILWWKYADQK